MATSTFSPEDWLEGIVNLIAALHNICLLIYHVRQIKQTKVSVVKVSSICAIAVPIVYTLMVGLNPWISWLRTSSMRCAVWMKMTNFNYGLSKTLMYLVFMERLFTVFGGSYLSFGKWTKIETRIAFLCYAVVACGVTNILSGSKYNPTTGRCEWDPAGFAYFLGALSCIIVEVGISIAFSRRLVQLNALKTSLKAIRQTSRASFKNANHHSKTWILLQKSAVCTFITLVCSPMSIIIGYFAGFTGLWAAIDMMLTSWMVMLVFSKHDRIYHRVCGRLESLLWTPCLYYYTCYCCTNLNTSIDGIVNELQAEEKKMESNYNKPKLDECRIAKLLEVNTFSSGGRTPTNEHEQEQEVDTQDTGDIEIVFTESDVSMNSVPSEYHNQSNVGEKTNTNQWKE